MNSQASEWPSPPCHSLVTRNVGPWEEPPGEELGSPSLGPLGLPRPDGGVQWPSLLHPLSLLLRLRPAGGWRFPRDILWFESHLCWDQWLFNFFIISSSSCSWSSIHHEIFIQLKERVKDFHFVLSPMSKEFIKYLCTALISYFCRVRLPGKGKGRCLVLTCWNVHRCEGPQKNPRWAKGTGSGGLDSTLSFLLCLQVTSLS